MWEKKHPRCSGSAKGVLPIILAVGYHVNHVPWLNKIPEETRWEIYGIFDGSHGSQEKTDEFSIASAMLGYRVPVSMMRGGERVPVDDPPRGIRGFVIHPCG